MTDLFKPFQQRLSNYLTEVVIEFGQDQDNFQLAQPSFELLKPYLVSGKLLRGSLVLALHQALTDAATKINVLPLAAAVEVIHSGALIQDDIMDGDVKRRGNPAFHVSMLDKIALDSFNHRQQLAHAAGVCTADMLFFWAMELVDRVPVEIEVKTQLFQAVRVEMTRLTLAQTEDIRLSLVEPNQVTESDIIQMLLAKSGSYTVRWPLELAGLVNTLPADQLRSLNTIGEKIGLLFQLQDDYLGVFGQPETMGKGVGSDITSGKKTLYWYYTWQQLAATDQNWWRLLWRQDTLSRADLDRVRSLMTNTGAVQQVEALQTRHRQELESAYKQLDLPESAVKLLRGVEEMVVSREK